MKFSKTLRERQIQEWKEKYLSYDDLKMLVMHDEGLFLAGIEHEIEKVEQFYRVLENGAERGLKQVMEMFPEAEFPRVHEAIEARWKIPAFYSSLHSDSHTQSSESHDSPSRRRAPKKALKGILLGRPQKYRRRREHRVLDFYVALDKISKYRETNLIGFRKILKKFDKCHGSALSAQVMDQVKALHAFKSPLVPELMEFTKFLYREITPLRRRSRVKKLVANIRKAERTNELGSFLAGLFMATGLIPLLPALLADLRDVIVYRMLFCIDCVFLFFGLLMLVSRTYFVNYRLILGHSPRSYVIISEYFLLVSVFILLQGVAAHYSCHGSIVAIGTFILLLFPGNLFFRSARTYFLRTLVQICGLNVFGRVRFKHFFIADHLLSLRGPLIAAIKSAALPSATSQWAVLAVCVVPIAIRVVQCLRRHLESKRRRMFPHLLNTIKYLVILSSDLALMAASPGIRRAVALLLLLASSAYSTMWDISVDWLLFGRPRMYPIGVYVSAGGMDVLCRVSSLVFAVARTSTPGMEQAMQRRAEVLLCALEMVRRFLWGVVRVEVEHLNNCDKLKALGAPFEDLFYKEDEGKEYPGAQ